MNPLTLPAGMLQMAQNVRLDRGVIQTRKGAKRLADSISAGQSPVTIPFTFGTAKAATITRSGSTATVTCTEHGFSNGTIVAIEGATQTEYNGYAIVVGGATADTFTYTVSGSPATPATGTITVQSGPVLRDVYSGGIFAAGVFSSPRYDVAQEYIVLAGPSSAFLYRQGETIVEKSCPTSPAETIVEKSYPTSPAETIEGTDTVSFVQAFDRLYLLREADQTVSGWGEQTTNGSGITVSTTTATVNVTGHGYSAGMRVRIEGGTVAAFNGHEYDILASPAPAANTFAITVPSGTANDVASGIRVRRVKAPLVWDGGSGNFTRTTAGVPSAGASFKTLRSCGWAAFIGNRLIVPDGRDQLMVSDLLDANMFDPFWNSFRLNEGSNDYLVGVMPWVQGRVLVFMRKSIWMATLGEQSTFTDGSEVAPALVTKLELLTNEIGCAARRTIVRAGQYVFFLSDAGVYRLDTGLDLSLRGDTRPLSDPVADQLASVDATLVGRACALWHNNRYLLAVPGTGQPSGNATNNILLAWNALNGQWEYRDVYGFGVDSLVVSDYDSERRVFSVSVAGKLMLLEQIEAGDESPEAGNSTVTAVPGLARTRRLNLQDMHGKRWLRSVCETVLPAGAAMTVKVGLFNPDAEVTVGTLTNGGSAEEDYNFKGPVRRMAHAAELVFETTAGRPVVRAAALEAAQMAMSAALSRTEG